MSEHVSYLGMDKLINLFQSSRQAQRKATLAQCTGCRGNGTLEKCFLPLSDSRVGGGFWMVINSTFMGGSLANGAWPCASSRMVIPKDQMSARLLYLVDTAD